MKRWQCPKCGSLEMEVIVVAWALLVQEMDGNFQTSTQDARDGSHEWNGDNRMQCLECMYHDKAARFEVYD